MYSYTLPPHMKASARRMEGVTLKAREAMQRWRQAQAQLAQAQKPIMKTEGEGASRILPGTVTHPELIALERDRAAETRLHEKSALRPATKGVPHQPKQRVYREPAAHFLNTRKGRIQVVYKRSTAKRWAER